MPEFLYDAQTLWLMGAALAAGTVYGFAGFGAALVFMPVAVVFVDPLMAVAAFSVSALISLVTVVPSAWKQAQKPAVGTMLVASWVAAPFGLWVLANADVTVARWAVSVVVLVTLVALVAGWRYQSRPGRRTWSGVGLGVGFLGGSTGLNGPILVLFQLGGQDSVEQSRANTACVLTLNSLGLMPLMALQGFLTSQAIWLGAVLLPLYGIGTLLGRALFRPQRVHLYRITAYTLIAAAGVAGLPIWTQ